MSLLSRIATSNGDRARKAAAYRILTDLDQNKVVTWNRQLQGEIYRKKGSDTQARNLAA